jgi:hypothetical protein
VTGAALQNSRALKIYTTDVAVKEDEVEILYQSLVIIRLLLVANATTKLNSGDRTTPTC